MIKKALEYIVGLKEPEILDFEGLRYSDKELYRIKKPIATAINLNTLTGLVDYIKSKSEEWRSAKLLVHIVDYETVELISPLSYDKRRETYICSNAYTPTINFGRFLDTENFNIMMQSCFLDTEDRKNILKLIGNIKEEAVRTVGDDGVSQQVTAKSGIARVEEVAVPNPVTLIPYRTFPEAIQPESKFIFRMQDGPKAALFEADGGAWKNQAILNIKEFLECNLKDIENVEIIA